MIRSIESNLGFTVLLGGPGLGKTTLLLHLLTQYRDSARTAFIFQTQCKRSELLRFLACELELPATRHDEVTLHQRLKEMLVDEARAGRKVLIFIDEAQNLRQPSLEAIRLLSDFETARAKLLHITLAGSAQLGETLLAPELSQLAQRISTVCRLEPLIPEEVSGYVTLRLRIAGCRAAELLFSPEALAEVAEQSEGVPRVINSVCFRALVIAHAAGERRINVKMVVQAARELDLTRPSGAAHTRTTDPLERGESSRRTKADPIVEEERQIEERQRETETEARRGAAFRSEVFRTELPDPAREKEIHIRSEVMSPEVQSVEQPLFLQSQDKIAPEVVWNEGRVSEVPSLLPYSSRADAPDRRFSWRSFTKIRSSLILSALLLHGAGLGVGGQELHFNSTTVRRDRGPLNHFMIFS